MDDIAKRKIIFSNVMNEKSKKSVNYSEKDSEKKEKTIKNLNPKNFKLSKNCTDKSDIRKSNLSMSPIKHK